MYLGMIDHITIAAKDVQMTCKKVSVFTKTGWIAVALEGDVEALRGYERWKEGAIGRQDLAGCWIVPLGDD